MTNTIPSHFQTVISNETAEHLAKLIEKEGPVIFESKLMGIAPADSDYMPELPASMVKAWAGACAETFRTLLLEYWKSLGLCP